MNKLKIRASKDDFGRTISLYAYIDSLEHKTTVDIATSMVFEQQDKCMEMRPFVQISNSDAQKLIDDLWHMGLRPTESHGSTGQIAATEKHLKDMRKLVSKFAEVDLT